jgi:hypothetical protein
MGIVTKTYLEAVVRAMADAGGKHSATINNEAAASLEATFPACNDPKADLARGFRFWEQVSIVGPISLRSHQL